MHLTSPTYHTYIHAYTAIPQPPASSHHDLCLPPCSLFVCHTCSIIHLRNLSLMTSISSTSTFFQPSIRHRLVALTVEQPRPRLVVGPSLHPSPSCCSDSLMAVLHPLNTVHSFCWAPICYMFMISLVILSSSQIKLTIVNEAKLLSYHRNDKWSLTNIKCPFQQTYKAPSYGRSTYVVQP